MFIFSLRCPGAELEIAMGCFSYSRCGCGAVNVFEMPSIGGTLSTRNGQTMSCLDHRDGELHHHHHHHHHHHPHHPHHHHRGCDRLRRRRHCRRHFNLSVHLCRHRRHHHRPYHRHDHHRRCRHRLSWCLDSCSNSSLGLPPRVVSRTCSGGGPKTARNAPGLSGTQNLSI